MASHHPTSRRHPASCKPARVRDFAQRQGDVAIQIWCMQTLHRPPVAMTRSTRSSPAQPAGLVFTILRNMFAQTIASGGAEVEDARGQLAKTLEDPAVAGAHREFEEFRAALDKLPQDQRRR